ncbi:MAG: RHS repeat-associated core domain-containing protein [Planctomycetota bacterium]
MPSSFPCDEARPEARGGLVARYEYDPYGRIVGPDTNADGKFDAQDDPGFYAAANPFRWSTKRLDPETGSPQRIAPSADLSDFGMRYYSATLGRWLNRDPIGDFATANLVRHSESRRRRTFGGLGGANVYAYVGNNPTNRTDYLGMMWIPCPPGEPCDDEGSSSSGPPSQEENDKKPCPGEGPFEDVSCGPAYVTADGQPCRPDPPGPSRCETFCSNYTDIVLKASCILGCLRKPNADCEQTCIHYSLGSSNWDACMRGCSYGPTATSPGPCPQVPNAQNCPQQNPGSMPGDGWCIEDRNPFHMPPAAGCARGYGANSGKQCCYDGLGCLIGDGAPGAGTSDVVGPSTGEDRHGFCDLDLVHGAGHLICDMVPAAARWLIGCQP